MRVVIISDTHFGDKKSTLISFDSENRPCEGVNYSSFREVAGENSDYLVLLGDIIDFSINDYKDSYDAASLFFKMVKRDRIAEKVIYVPGNHDSDIWHTVEYQTNIINRIKSGRSVRKFRHSVPGILDMRRESSGSPFTLPGISVNRGDQLYGGLFLDNISGEKQGESTNFSFAYPNLYLVTEDDGMLLLTHGHFFETPWSFISDWIPEAVGRKEMGISDPPELCDLVSVNFPVTQFMCSGAGQSGPLSEIIRQFQYDFQNKDVSRIKKYLDRVDDKIDKETDYGLQFWKEWGTDSVSNSIKRALVEWIVRKESNKAKDNDNFLHNKSVLKRIENYCISSLSEVSDLNKKFNYSLPDKFSSLLFGHTHKPLSANTVSGPEVFSENRGESVRLLNAGGWLTSSSESSGGEVFIYDSQTGLTSERISVSPLI